MERFGKSFYLGLIVTIFCLFVGQAECAGDVTDHPGAQAASREPSGHLITVEAYNTPLEEILKELSQQTGAEFTVRDTWLLQDPVTASFRNLTFADATARLLQNYNYILQYEEKDHAHLIIFASKGSGELLSGGRRAYDAAAGQEIDVTRNTMQREKPESLDECRGLDFAEDDMAASRSLMRQDPQNAHIYRQMLEEDRKALDDAKIRRAQKVLAMERCAHLWETAIREVTKIQDDRVTSLLADVAKNGKHVSLKTAATEALWRNTAGSEFSNVKGMNALRSLTTSSDEGVRHYAQQALKDYEHYVARTASGGQ